MSGSSPGQVRSIATSEGPTTGPGMTRAHTTAQLIGPLVGSIAGRLEHISHWFAGDGGDWLKDYVIYNIRI